MDPSSPAQSTQAPTARPRVLAVDDTPDVLKQLRLAIRSAGMDCFTCSSGQAAVDFLARELVDVAVVDLQMPGMDGFEVCRQLKFHERTRDIPVLLLSANMSADEKARGMEVGMHDYLNKPIEQQDFQVRVHAALRCKLLYDELVRQMALPAQLEAEQQQLRQKVNAFQQGMISSHWQNRFGQLAAAFTAEIQQPLTTAQSGVQLLMVADGLRDEVRDRFRLIDADLRRVTAGLRRLLVVGQPARQQQVIYLSQFVEELAMMTQGMLFSQGITLAKELDPTCEWRGMPSELGRATLYLLFNAMEAVSDLQEGHIRLQVDHDDTRQFIRIADNGPGIPEEVAGQIFDPFFTTKGPPHTGAGLYLARAIIKAANGTIEVKSPADGAATEFIINLPRNTLPAPAPVPAADVAPPPAG